MIMLNLALTILLELVFFRFALSSRDPGRLIVFCAVNMLGVALYAPWLFAIEIGGLTLINNIPSVFYAFVILTSITIHHLFGRRAVIDCINTVFFALACAIALSWAVRLFPVISKDPAAAALMVATDRSNATVAASFIAFVAAMLAMLAALRIRSRWRYVIAVVAAQAVDSGLFYPMAYYESSSGEVADLIIVGIAVKLVFSLIAAGPIYLMIRGRRT